MCRSEIARRLAVRSRRCFACMGTCLALTVATWAFATHAAAGSAAPSAPADPQRQLLAALTELLQRQPDHVGAIYVAARTAASLGDESVALQWLENTPVSLVPSAEQLKLIQTRKEQANAA